jgi:hypothetical protein
MEMMWAAQINVASLVARFIVALRAGMLDEIGIWNLANKIAPLP